MFFGAASPGCDRTTPEGSGPASNAIAVFVNPGWLAEILPAEVSVGKMYPSRAFARSVSCIPAAGRDDRVGPRRTLMATVGAPLLFAKRSDTTLRTAIPLTPITGAAEGENRVASAAHAAEKRSRPEPPSCQTRGAGQGRQFMAG
jgi:hypothetical protein